MKFFLKSKTMQGVWLGLVTAIMGYCGIDITSEYLSAAVNEIIALYPIIVPVISAIYASYGRMKAKEGLTIKWKGGKDETVSN